MHGENFGWRFGHSGVLVTVAKILSGINVGWRFGHSGVLDTVVFWSQWPKPCISILTKWWMVPWWMMFVVKRLVAMHHGIKKCVCVSRHFYITQRGMMLLSLRYFVIQYLSFEWLKVQTNWFGWLKPWNWVICMHSANSLTGMLHRGVRKWEGGTGVRAPPLRVKLGLIFWCITFL